MKRERVRVVAVCEDPRQRSFLQQLFERLRLRPLEIRTAPDGRGSAEQWVRQQVCKEVKAHRSRAANQANLALVLMTDGDRLGVAVRRASLNKALTDASQLARQDEERILYLVPTWSVETWLAWLSGAAAQLGGVDETTRYKSHPLFSRLFAAGVISAKIAVAAWLPVLPNEQTTVPSLSSARLELDRIL